MKVRIGNRSVGAGESVLIIAEAGVNHNGNLKMARALINLAADADADAVKFQTFKADHIVTPEAPKAEYQLSTTGAAESQLEMLRRLELSPEAHRELQEYCRERKIIFLSTPFDEAAADLLESLNVPAYKISSGDLTNLPLLEHVARKGKPILISTGMADLGEVGKAVSTVRAAGCEDLILLQCVTNYPARAEEVNLRAMLTMQTEFSVPVGYSDHTEGIEIALAAVALGACVIEKHFTLDRNLPGPDHRASLEPGELRSLIAGVRRVEAALGDGRKVPTASEVETAKVARRSLVAAKDIPAGSALSRELIALKRPGTGLPPAGIDSLIGRIATVDVKAGEILTLEMFE